MLNRQLLFVLRREQELRNRYTKYILWKKLLRVPSFYHQMFVCKVNLRFFLYLLKSVLVCEGFLASQKMLLPIGWVYSSSQKYFRPVYCSILSTASSSLARWHRCAPWRSPGRWQPSSLWRPSREQFPPVDADSSQSEGCSRTAGASGGRVQPPPRQRPPSGMLTKPTA